MSKKGISVSIYRWTGIDQREREEKGPAAAAAADLPE
jgi:hypothetical protein